MTDSVFSRRGRRKLKLARDLDGLGAAPLAAGGVTDAVTPPAGPAGVEAFSFWFLLLALVLLVRLLL